MCTDTAGLQWDTAGYSGSAAKWLDKDMDGYRADTAGYQGYGEIQAGYTSTIQAG